MPALLERFDHPAWMTGAATVAGYALILLAMFVTLFVVPYLVFTML
jgi:membrane protein YdbS with pleckstrin-like domain